jgi:hypothetical protein
MARKALMAIGPFDREVSSMSRSDRASLIATEANASADL